MQKEKRVVVRVGDIFKISLEDGEYCYCMNFDEGMRICIVLLC